MLAVLHGACADTDSHTGAHPHPHPYAYAFSKSSTHAKPGTPAWL